MPAKVPPLPAGPTGCQLGGRQAWRGGQEPGAGRGLRCPSVNTVAGMQPSGKLSITEQAVQSDVTCAPVTFPFDLCRLCMLQW